MKKFFFASLFMFLCLISVDSTSLKAQFEEDLPQITTNDTLNYPIKTVWKSIKRAFFLKGTFSDPSTREPKLDEKTNLYRGSIRSDFCVFAAGPDIRGGKWVAGRVKYEFRVREITEEQTTVSLVCGISGYEDAVTGSVHFWNSNGILDKEILELVHKLAADPETLNFKEDRMK
jgi:hypothetical protein